jgi:hypothetical protein
MGLMLPAERDTAAGVVDDARPDQWGERVIHLTAWLTCTVRFSA